MGFNEEDVKEIKRLCLKYELNPDNIRNHAINSKSPERFTSLRTLQKLRNSTDDRESIKMLISKAGMSDLANPTRRDSLKALKYLLDYCP